MTERALAMPKDHDPDFDFDVAPGIPAPLPTGERLLWQGRPNTWRLAVESVLLKWVMAYFGLLIVWRFLATLAEHPTGIAFASTLPLVLMGLGATLLIWGFAWVQARATIYSITSARIIMRIGAALPLTLNIPFKQLTNARLDLRSGGTGTLAFETLDEGNAKLSYLVCWPHVRPWKMKDPEPALRCIADAQEVATLLAEAAESHMSLPQVARRAAVPANTSVGPAASDVLPAE